LTVAFCVKEALGYCKRRSLKGEVIVADNGSTDGSVEAAKDAGAIVVSEPIPGYGAALRRGLAKSRGAIIIMADCDMTYDLDGLDRFYVPLMKDQADMVIGNRFRGGIEKGAMPFLHRIGVPLLTIMGNIRYATRIGDYHCGLRSIKREALERLDLHTTGMEFATEMIAEASRNNLRILEVPTILKTPPKGRSSKLRTFHDGFRHVRFIFWDTHKA
jgi:glycosyltransferase involved in cell wall biosynthesis